MMGRCGQVVVMWLEEQVNGEVEGGMMGRLKVG